MVGKAATEAKALQLHGTISVKVADRWREGTCEYPGRSHGLGELK